MASAVDISYVYQFPSALELVSGKRHLRLATSGGVEQHPYFFKGRLLEPRMTADMLLCVSLISRTRFYSPTELRQRLLAAADPVVTSGGDRLRFEAFSVCCGAYARLDLKSEAIDGEWIGRGTTNVDFNPPMRTALIGLLDSEQVGLNVGDEGVELESSGKSIVEKKVKLPVRWLKGFVEVQAYQARMKPVFEISAHEARQFLRGLPVQQTWSKGTVSYIVPAGKGIRLSQRSAPGAVAIGAPGRLKVLEELIRHAKAIRIYSGDDGVTGWEITLPHANFHLVLSPEAARGFSGEGQALKSLVTSADANQSLNKLRAELQWQSKIVPGALSARVGMDAKEVDGLLSVLGTRGLVGYDLAEGAYFHRELPFNLELVEELQPRLQRARELVSHKRVRITSKSAAGEVEAYVKGTETEHHVKLDENGARCTCPWYSKYPGERGPCAHILAVEIMVQDSAD